ncbi:MAG: hypothetical protein KDK07_20650 [Bauldia sp.]|nr:hypothetical protein [Bauldia sp.]
MGWLAPCAVCGRQSRGFLYCHLLRRDRFPDYSFCSRTCLERGMASAKENNGVIDKTAREMQALKDARRPFAEALTELGLMDAFFNRTASEVDRLIEAVVTGYIESMQSQTEESRAGVPFDDPIPF